MPCSCYRLFWRQIDNYKAYGILLSLSRSKSLLMKSTSEKRRHTSTNSTSHLCRYVHIPIAMKVYETSNNLDTKTRMATQLAKLYSGACWIIEIQPRPMREQHDHSQITFGRDFWLLRRANDPNKDQKFEESDVWRIFWYLQVVLGGSGTGE